MKSSVAKRSVVLGGHKTRVSLEGCILARTEDIATSRRMTLRDVITSIDLNGEHGDLSSALRCSCSITTRCGHYRTELPPPTLMQVMQR